jgi:hypothetical protein
MKTKLFKKVFIEGKEENLPREGGFYITSFKYYSVLEYHYRAEVKRNWLKEADWYLMPLPNEPQGAEEILAKVSGCRLKYIKNPFFAKAPMITIEVALQAMHDFACQTDIAKEKIIEALKKREEITYSITGKSMRGVNEYYYELIADEIINK